MKTVNFLIFASLISFSVGAEAGDGSVAVGVQKATPCQIAAQQGQPEDVDENPQSQKSKEANEKETFNQ